MELLCFENVPIEFFKTNHNDRFEVYYDEHRNNIIVFNPIHHTCTKESIVEFTLEIAYLQLMLVLLENKNQIVKWEQDRGSISSFTIFQDVILQRDQIQSYLKIDQVLYMIERETTTIPHIYTRLKDGVRLPIYE